MTASEISILLYRQWDALGVQGFAPADEYDAYAEILAAALSEGATVDAICAYLSDVRATALLTAADPAEDRRIAELIKASS